MPRENRKRGKKHKKSKEEEYHASNHQAEELEPQVDESEQQHAGPSWIVHRQAEEENKEAPFGYVDVEVKAYFRTVDLQIRDWQEQGRPDLGGDEESDPNEDRRLFFVAALTEMEGKEKQLATDPDCSTVLERMIHSMDDFVRRVFMDRLSGSFEQLVMHRFASHVCQTLFSVAADTIYRESRGILPSSPEDANDKGELRTLTQLVLDVCDELLPTLSSLVLDPFASHVIRALLLTLAPACFLPDAREHAVRSKKSAAWKARQGSMKSVFLEQQEGVSADSKRARVPGEFRKPAERFVRALRGQLGENEVRALAADKVASPVLQVVRSAFGLVDPGDSNLVVPCILRALDVEDYKAALVARAEQDARHEDKDGEQPRKRARRDTGKEEGAMEPRVQGALLLQSLLRLSSPHNEFVLNSLQSLTMDEQIEMAHHPTSSRVLDVLLSSPTVPAKLKRKFVLSFMGRFHELVDDRIGSRVGERCWAAADGYMKEKIARSLMPHEHFLAGSFYGKFFARVLNLQLLKRDPDRWKDAQTSAGASTSATAPPAVQPAKGMLKADVDTQSKQEPVADAIIGDEKSKKRKRKAQKEDEIDALFESTLGRKVKKSELKPVGGGDVDGKTRVEVDKDDEPTRAGKKGKKGKGEMKSEDKDLRDVLGAIKAAPKDDGGKGKKGKKGR
ncbi:hypothetical protein EVJ58_g8672 [Rhodofomes roseus]|uniref:Nucleolar protein 9 n=1 Tax=Rhodofomes roseus TaxID=34475 RepID=A0A4Y9XZ61_9APHY|nr:hypothetical protein EVJ58_g8672 [Rhodofomes roseus]